MTGFNDENLKTFLKKNMPEAPAAPRGEFQEILERVQAPSLLARASRFRSLLAGMATFAAGFSAVILINHQQPSTSMVVEDELGAIEEVVSFDEELEAVDVGDEYLNLIATIR